MYTAVSRIVRKIALIQRYILRFLESLEKIALNTHISRVPFVSRIVRKIALIAMTE